MNNTLYTDGHGIKVTTTKLYTGKVAYRLDGVLNAYMNSIRPQLFIPIMLILLGIVCIVSGFTHLLPDKIMSSFYFLNLLITSNLLSIIGGILLILSGLLMATTARTQYAVHIVTAEGEKDPIVSQQKDYISQIVSALQQALKLKTRFQTA